MRCATTWVVVVVLSAVYGHAPTLTSTKLRLELGGLEHPEAGMRAARHLIVTDGRMLKV